ncbi:gamma-glutamyltransferase [Roseiconus lacunae]|uniref:gamma-glutamyltransferase n=1 Tax=Roseiconus lacunae TaxID=2605694 RepID=UPI0011F0A805|nr:gamma-glutamyltransferase [Roseiconus lacunae]
MIRHTSDRRFPWLLAIVFSAAMLVPAKLPLSAQGEVRRERGDRGMVVSDSVHASRVGRDVIAKGGNAVDAAVATAFALAVTWPEAGNIGGGGFMMIRPANGQDPVCVDYRERAPMAAEVDTFVKGESRHTRKVVGVPGTVRGLELAHQTYGRLAWRDLVMPAARLASEGFSVDGFLARSTNRVLDATRGNAAFAELHRVYGKPDGMPWKSGDVMTLPDLARTLTLIANEGAGAFYEGAVADLLLRETAKGGGLIRKKDLVAYEAKIREPIVGTFRDYTIIGAPPPSSGGIALVQGLNMVEAIDLPKDKSLPQTIHLLTEISRRFFLDRARYLGDPDFVKIPEYLTTKQYARQLIADIDGEHATDSAALAPDIKLAPESDDTTHFSVIDGDGMVVSNTYTIEASWGSRIVVPGAGFLLNNEMGDFNWTKGYTDRSGYIGSDANLVEPGKRMLSSQCPVIVTKNNQPVLVTGSPGGRTILNTVFNVVLNVIHFDMPATLAVKEKRYHHQWMPDVLYLEDTDEMPFEAMKSQLEAYGHRISNRVSQGSAHTIWVDPVTGHVYGIADYRRGGRAVGLSSAATAR